MNPVQELEQVWRVGPPLPGNALTSEFKNSNGSLQKAYVVTPTTATMQSAKPVCAKAMHSTSTSTLQIYAAIILHGTMPEETSSKA